MRANGTCGSDLHYFVEGRLDPFMMTCPYVPGHEASGSVAALGEGVTGISAGDAVVQVGWPGSNVLPLDVSTFLTQLITQSLRTGAIGRSFLFCP